MSVDRLALVVQTCWASPVQWHAWTVSGRYLYMHYRYGRGMVDAFPGPDERTWGGSFPEGSVARFCDPDEPMRGFIELEVFLARTGLGLDEDARVVGFDEWRTATSTLSEKNALEAFRRAVFGGR